MSSLKTHGAAYAALLLAAGCAERLAPLQLAEGCQPLLAGADCMLPFPSDFFLVEDAALPSGRRVELARAAKPKTTHNASADVGEWRPADGASRLASPTAVLGVPVSASGLVGYLDDPERSLSPQSPTLLLEASSGTPVPHFVDLDPLEPAPEKRALVLHPLVSLKARTRYVVVLHGVLGEDGSAAPAPEGFRRLRDRQAAGDPALEPLASRYEREVFPVLERANIDRREVQLAWDFTVGSDEWIEADLLRVRELTRAWLSAQAPRVTVTEVSTSQPPDVWRTVRGTFEAPRFLLSDEPGVGLYRDAEGTVAQNGTVEVPFLAVVPAVLRDQPGEAISLGYGHGSFGSRDEILSSNPRALAAQSRAVMFSTDWVGMSWADVGGVLQTLASKPSRGLLFSERVPQGMANWMVLRAAIAGPLRGQPAFQDMAGAPLYPAEASRFIGISQGHILGGVLAAVEPGLRRVALLSGGGGFTHMFSRSRPLNAFFLVLDVKEGLERRKFESMLQPYFDRIDGAFWGRHVLAEPLEGNAPRSLLMQVGLGDVEVPNVGAFLQARVLGLPLLQPSPVPVYGLDPVTAPTSGSALALYDFGIDLREVYGSAQPYPQENQVHLGERELPTAKAQLRAFFGAEGQVVQPCDGPCDPN